MNTRNFEVLYTHQKLKKAKTWKDGCLKISCNGTKAVLFNDQGCSLEVFHIHLNKIFPGSDVECERYLISVGDEKITEEITQDNHSSCVQANKAKPTGYGANSFPAARSDLPGSTWRKRKRDFNETFRPTLPRPRQDLNPPGNLSQSANCLKRPTTNDHGLPEPTTISRSIQMRNNLLTSTARGENNFYPQNNCEETTSIQRIDQDNYSRNGANVIYNQVASPTRGETNFYPQRTCQETTSHSVQNVNLDNYDRRGIQVNYNVVATTANVAKKFISQKTNQGHIPTQKRNRSELLSLFGGESRVVPHNEKQGLSSIETIDSLPQSLSTVSDYENVFHRKILPSTNNLFCQPFDISLGDEDDFSDTSFQSLYNPKTNTYFPSTSSRPVSLPWESDEVHVTSGNNALLDNQHIGSENYNVLLDYNHDDDDDELIMFSTLTERPTRSSLDGRNVKYKNHSFCNPTDSTSMLNGLPWESEKSQVSNVMDNEYVDPEIDNILLNCDDDDYDNDDLVMFSTSCERPRFLAGRNVENREQCFGNRNLDRLAVDDDPIHYREQGSLQDSNSIKRGQPLNNIPSTSTSFFQERQRSSSTNNQFTPPFMPSASNNRASSSYQHDCGTSNIGPVTVESSVRPQSFSGELYFPSDTECCGSVTPTRQVTISTTFSSAIDYKGVLKSALREHLNIILFELAQKYHGILSKADITSFDDTLSDEKENVKGPSCSHGPAKLRAVKKDGPNKGRHFYTCPGSGSNQCKFFQWADESPTASTSGNKKISLTSSDSIRVFFKSKGIYFYHNCVMERRSLPTKFYGKKYSRKGSDLNNGKRAMYILLKYRDSSSLYTKDDIWIISKSVNFEPRSTFVAKSSFYGPSSSGDLEIEPVSGYSPSNWRSGDTVHAIWACNAGTELSCIQNIDDYVTLQQMPLLPYILNGSHPLYNSQRHSFSAPFSGGIDRNSLGLSWPIIERETEKIIALYKLNPDQATAIRSCAKMFVSENEEMMAYLPITLIHGVFGAGKSFLLAVVVLLMVKLFEIADAFDEEGTRSITWKILISSTTNVAVDRILLGLLDLGFDQFVRVGSVRKIAKPVLPFSIHSIGTKSQELKELQGMLKTELTGSEKAYVRKSIEMHKWGENRKRLANVRVVGVTCAACTFAALERLKFPVLLLDECSQMTEPTSLLPMARFGCRKLVLVGDPKQLNPTIQGSEPSHQAGLEQTMFDRLMKMDLKPILLRMQYRCHPVISSISSRLFYNDQLLDGVNAEEREPLVFLGLPHPVYLKNIEKYDKNFVVPTLKQHIQDFIQVDFIPTLCFYNVTNGKEECSQDGSYFNTAEAKFVVVLIKSLLESEIEPKQLGVITQYKSQLTAITNSLSADGATSHKEWACIQISTVDAFQGGEKDVIILSCVRTKHIGFIDCERRTNVALTRAKRHLCIVGCGKILSSNSLWSKILTICRESPEGFQSSESYIKQWNERRPISDDNSTKGTSSKPKKPRKSREGDGSKITPKPSNETHNQQATNVSKPNTSFQNDDMPSSHSSCVMRSEFCEVQEIFNSDPALDNENMYSADTIDNGDVFEISEDADAFEACDVSHDNGKAFEISDNDDRIQDQQVLGKEVTVVEKQTNDCESNCSDYMFGDDSLVDDELCKLDF